MSHGTKPTILLIEADASLRRLIVLGLQYRGMHVIEASSPSHIPPLETARPDLLVLDVDDRVHGDGSLLAIVRTSPTLSALPIVMLAWEYLVPANVAGTAGGVQSALQAQVTCLTKPFDARTLQAAIEQLLISKALQETQQAQEILSTAQTALSEPSIWPLLTAAGLFLMFIGLMGLLAVTVLGLLVVVISLLWWTIGTKRPAPISFSS